MYSHCYHHHTHTLVNYTWYEMNDHAWLHIVPRAVRTTMCSSTVHLWFPTQSSVNVNETMFSHWWTKPIYCIDVANDFAIKSLISWRAERWRVQVLWVGVWLLTIIISLHALWTQSFTENVSIDITEIMLDGAATQDAIKTPRLLYTIYKHM